MVRLEVHREARKERASLPRPLQERFAALEEAIGVNPYSPAFKRESGWGRHTVSVAGIGFRGTSYRMAWEVVSTAHVVIWAYGAHEGFYERLARRARQ